MFTPTQPDPQDKNKNDNNIDDLFSSPPPPAGAPPGAYTPPPPQPQQRRTNPVLYIILGVVIAFMCLCVGCIAVTGGLGIAIFQNPTVQAGFATVQGVVGTGVALAEVPATLPTNANSKSTLSAGQQQSGQLNPLDRDVWKYDGKANEQITISLTAQDRGLSLVFGLYDPNGKLLNKSSLLKSGDQNQTLSFTLPNDGTYSILVSSPGGTANSNGNYTIVVNSGAR